MAVFCSVSTVQPHQSELLVGSFTAAHVFLQLIEDVQSWGC